jgi:hypothetical protein
MEYLFSIGGPTVEALAENLFRFAIDAEDVRTVNKLMKLSINPNEQIYYSQESGYSYSTPLHLVCEMRSLKLVKVLIDGGVKVDFVGDRGIRSILEFAVCGSRAICEPMPRVDPGLVKTLLNAGAAVNPSLSKTLHHALGCGRLEVVNLISAGADVNGTVFPSPLIRAISVGENIHDADVINMVRILLKAGADPQTLAAPTGSDRMSPLEYAMPRESVELMRLLLKIGSQVTERSLVRAVRKWNINVVELLLKFGGQVTVPIVESVVESNSTLVFFLLETMDDRTQQRSKNIALIKSIEWGDMDLIHRLSAFGAQLTEMSRLSYAIENVIEKGNTHVLSFLLDERSGYRALSLESLDRALWTA